MAPASTRLQSLLAHLVPSSTPSAPSTTTAVTRPVHIHTLSPTSFLPRAAAIEPSALAIHHITANGATLRRTYAEFADRAGGLAYFLLKHGLKRVGILASNAPAFLEAIYGVAAAGGVHVGVNYRLKVEDVKYIFEFAGVDSIIVDAEFLPLLDSFRASNPKVPFIIDTDSTVGTNPFDQAVEEGLKYDTELGSRGWEGLQAQAHDEDDTIAIPFTSGTTAKPKGVVYTHRGCYLAALGNVAESGLNMRDGEGRCGYLWTLPMFHAVGWTFPWAVTAVRGTHYCLRKIDYPLIWKLLKEHPITHFNAAPTVNTLLCADPSASKLPRPVRVTVAASPPTAHLFSQMTALNLLPVHVYGLTETYGPITKGYILPEWETIPEKEKYAKMARQGHGFLTSLPVRVIKTPGEDEAGNHNGIKEGDVIDVAKDGKEIGEIVFVGNICAKEYYNDAAATQKLLAGGVSHSGDLAVWEPDGAIRILDRQKDIIISGGENISSVALEAMLVQHPKVLEAGVVGVQDEKWGETPKAYVTIKEAMSMDEGGKELIDWAKNESAISKFMVPREVEVVRELPKTSTGKVKKHVLRQWAKGNYEEK